MLYAYINGVYTEVEKLKIQRVLSGVGRISFITPAVRFASPIEDFQNYTYELYFRDRLIVNAGVIETSRPSTKNSTFIDMIEFTATDELGLLTIKSAKSTAVYQDETILFIIDDILRKADWKLGYVHGIADTDLFTIDLREKEDLFAQLKAASDLLPDFHFRYGGFIDGYHRLDIGPLGTKSKVSFVQGTSLLALKRLPQAQKKLYEIEAFGATTDTREVYLNDAYQYDNNLLLEDRYPVVNKSDGTWVVRDLATPTGDEVLRYYNEIKPTSATPTPTDMYQAGYALWKACIADFIKANTDIVTYEIEAVFGPEFISAYEAITVLDLLTDDDGNILTTDDDIELGFGTPLTTVINYDTVEEIDTQDILSLRPGDVSTVIGQVNVFLYNIQTQDYSWNPAYSLSEDLFISDVELEFTSGRQIKALVKTGIQSYNELYNEDIILARKSEKISSLLGVGYTLPVSLGTVIDSQTQSSIPPDTTMSNGELGKLFTILTPAIPPGTTELRFSYYTTSPDVTIETVQDATLTPSNWIGKATLNGDWDTSKSLTIYGVFIFR